MPLPADEFPRSTVRILRFVSILRYWSIGIHVLHKCRYARSRFASTRTLTYLRIANSCEQTTDFHTFIGKSKVDKNRQKKHIKYSNDNERICINICSLFISILSEFGFFYGFITLSRDLRVTFGRYKRCLLTNNIDQVIIKTDKKTYM